MRVRLDSDRLGLLPRPTGLQRSSRNLDILSCGKNEHKSTWQFIRLTWRQTPLASGSGHIMRFTQAFVKYFCSDCAGALHKSQDLCGLS